MADNMIISIAADIAMHKFHIALAKAFLRVSIDIVSKDPPTKSCSSSRL
ncbi:hypothetical protein [Mesorhizobium sp. M1A.F.Ca.ET.072.01.1.1]|nr:hypothetical protein [Mesorhizobium sp. M1A.F.Ca.ET.072.01.1.1]